MAYLKRLLGVSHKDHMMKLSARAEVSCEGLTGEGSSSKPPFVGVGRIQLLGGCWTEGLHSLLAIG